MWIKCDAARCPAQACEAWASETGALWWCRHHAHDYEAALHAAGFKLTEVLITERQLAGAR